MEVVFRVSTPKGRASKTNDQIKKFIIGFNRRHLDVVTYTNDEDSQIFWHCTGSVKQIMKVQKNLSRFDWIIKRVFEHKMMKKYGVSKLSKEDYEQLKDMLQNHTKVEIIKTASLQEMTEYNETYWSKIKKSFKKMNPFSKEDESEEHPQEEQEEEKADI